MSEDKARVEFTLWELFFLGHNLAMLQGVQSRTPIGPRRSDPIGVLERLRLLHSDLQEVELREAEKHVEMKLASIIRRLKDPNRQTHRLEHEAVEVRDLARQLWQVLEFEASNRTSFVVQSSREGKVEDILQDPAAYFGLTGNEMLQLSPAGYEDFQEASRCYAVGFSVAAIMFMLRATEDIARAYYRVVTLQRDGPQTSRINWGQINTVLSLPVLHCPSALLDQSRKLAKKRNKAMHPHGRTDTEWDEEAAERVLAHCRQLIEMMTLDASQRHIQHSAETRHFIPSEGV